MGKTIITLILVLGGSATGCGWFSDDKGFFVNRSDDYIDARQDPELVVPEDLDQTLEDPFPIPSIPPQQSSRFFPGRPPLPNAIYANDNRDEIRIQKLGKRVWLVVPEPPTTVWPKIKQFLAENGVGIASEQASEGRITTEWLEIEDTPYRDMVRTLLQEAAPSLNAIDRRDRLLVKVEQGLRELTSEVHVRHQHSDDDAAAIAKNPISLGPVQSSLEELEPLLLNEIGAYISARVAEQTVSMVAQDIAGKAKSELARSASNQPLLRLLVDEERAWATLAQALANAGMEIVTFDRAGALYHVRIPESAFVGGGKKNRGFFRRMFFFGGNNKAEEVLILVQREQEQIYNLTVQGLDGQAVPFELAQQVLVLLREYAT